MRRTRIFGGRSSLSFSSRPGSSSPPVKYSTLVGRDAVVVLQDAADPHRRGHLVLGHADALADQVLRLADAALRRDEDARMAEEARREHRDRDERRVLARSDTAYDDSDISATSNSRLRSMRKNVSSTCRLRHVELDAVGPRRCRRPARACGRSPSRRSVRRSLLIAVFPCGVIAPGLRTRARHRPARPRSRVDAMRRRSPAERGLVAREVAQHRAAACCAWPRRPPPARRARRSRLHLLGERHELALERAAARRQEHVHVAAVVGELPAHDVAAAAPSPSAPRTSSAPSRRPRGSARAA